MLHSKITVCLLALFGSISAAALKQKRATVTSSVYAYGDNIDGANVFFVDNLAYIGDTKPKFGNIAANITLSTDHSNSTKPWTLIAQNATTNASSSIDGSSLYIVPTTGSVAPVGFLSRNGTAPDGAVTTGFTWFGSQVAYLDDEGELEMKFWAVDTNATNLWSLVWNSDGALIDNARPVTLKETSPLVLNQ